MLSITSFLSGYAIPPKFVQEAEIKHGRVAMVSSVLIPILDHVDPNILGVNFVNSLSPDIQLGLFGIMGVSETAQILKAYKFPNEISDWFKMKEEHIPGNYSFNPLNSSSSLENELFIGRFAMIGAAVELTQELATNQPIF